MQIKVAANFLIAGLILERDFCSTNVATHTMQTFLSHSGYEKERIKISRLPAFGALMSLGFPRSFATYLAARTFPDLKKFDRISKVWKYAGLMPNLSTKYCTHLKFALRLLCNKLPPKYDTLSAMVTRDIKSNLKYVITEHHLRNRVIRKMSSIIVQHMVLCLKPDYPTRELPYDRLGSEVLDYKGYLV